jgi:hypothetical protein
VAAALFVAAGLFAGVVWYTGWYEEREWRAACAEVDQLDPGWRWDELLAKRPPVPDDQNAARHITAVRSLLLPKDWPDWQTVVIDADLPPGPVGPPPPAELDVPILPPGAGNDLDPAVQRQQAGQRLGESIDLLAPNHLLTARQVTALRALIPADALAEAKALCRLHTGRFEVPQRETVLASIVNMPIQDVRQAGQLLNYHAMLLAHDGKVDEALDDCRGMLTAARATGDTPSLINALVAMALRAVALGKIERVLGHGEPSPESLAALQRLLEADRDDGMFLHALRGERACEEDYVRGVLEGRVPRDELNLLDDPPAVTGNKAIDRWLHRLRGGGWRVRHGAAQLRFLSTVIEAYKVSPDEARLRQPELEAGRQQLPKFVADLLSSTMMVMDADRRMRAHLSAGVAALAAERFRRDRGRWPESLAELVPAYLAAAPADPFDGAPLRYRRLADGIVIYTVYTDLTDDGGDIRHDPATGTLPKDWGLRLWDVPHRRQPAPPPAAQPAVAEK